MKVQAVLIFAMVALASASQSQEGAQAVPVPPSEQIVGNSPVSVSQPVAPVSIVNEQHHQPGVAVSHAAVKPEQYGQPEPQQLPANYKPFGSWGLYVGGNPSEQDGHYACYYKSCDPVEKQVAGGEAVKPVPALSSVLRQAGVSPYGGDYYPFAYSAADLNTGLAPISPIGHSVSPVQAGAQIYGSPAVFESQPLPEHYAAKRVGGVKQVESSNYHVKGQQQQHHQVKGFQHQYQPQYQHSYYSYAPVVGQLANQQVVQGVQGVQQQQHQQHQQVYAYPVPVGSQIIGSQQGIDGAFSPYGVHAFTRYAVKPAIASPQDVVYQAAPVQGPVVYKQQHAYNQYASHAPLGFYGYPLSQVGYAPASGSYVASQVYQPAVVQSQAQSSAQAQIQAAPVQPLASPVHALAAPAEPQQAPISPAQVVAQVSQSEDKQEVDEKAYGTKH